jgi:hypothetical protein
MPSRKAFGRIKCSARRDILLNSCTRRSAHARNGRLDRRQSRTTKKLHRGKLFKFFLQLCCVVKRSPRHLTQHEMRRREGKRSKSFFPSFSSCSVPCLNRPRDYDGEIFIKPFALLLAGASLALFFLASESTLLCEWRKGYTCNYEAFFGTKSRHKCDYA